MCAVKAKSCSKSQADTEEWARMTRPLVGKEYMGSSKQEMDLSIGM